MLRSLRHHRLMNRHTTNKEFLGTWVLGYLGTRVLEYLIQRSPAAEAYETISPAD